MVLLLIWPGWHKTAGWDVPFLKLAMTIKRSLDTLGPFLFSFSPVTFKTLLNCNFKMLFCLLFGFQWKAFDKWHILWVLSLLGASCSWRLRHTRWACPVWMNSFFIYLKYHITFWATLHVNSKMTKKMTDKNWGKLFDIHFPPLSHSFMCISFTCGSPLVTLWLIWWHINHQDTLALQ